MTSIEAPHSDLTAKLVEALKEIAEHPGPNADDACWFRVDTAREALRAAEASPSSPQPAIPQDLAQIILQIGEAEWGATAPMTAEEHAAQEEGN